MNIGKYPVYAILMLALCFAVTLPSLNCAAGESVVLGYYPAWVRNTFPASEVNFSILTNIIHAFAWPDSNGNILVWKNFFYPELIDATHKAGRKISVALGGWGQCRGFPPVAADPVKRATFIKNIIAFCEEHGYDGIDLDWEFPANPTERDNLTILVNEIRETTDRRGKPFLLTMAVSAGTWSGDHNDYDALKDKVDWFNDMTYDFYGTWTDHAGHNAPLYATQESVNTSIMYLTKKMGIPSEKVLLGIPFYGRKFNASQLYGASTGGDGIVYRDVVKSVRDGGWIYNWDDVSQAPYLVNDKNTGVIFFDDPKSIAIKCDYVKKQNLRGVMIWSLGSDFMDGSQPLLEAIGQTMGKTGN